MRAFIESILGRCVTLILALVVALLGCELSTSMPPSSGAPQYEQPGFVAVPGGAVNAAGGNLFLERVDLSMDTLLGTWEIRAVYNSQAEEWLWSFQIRFDGSTFVDPTGAVYDVSAVANGAAVPGTIWIKVDSDTLQTKGGLAFDFDALGKLAEAHWSTLPHPLIRYIWSDELLEIVQCTAPEACLPIYWVELAPGVGPESATDVRTGRAAHFQYDARGRLIAARDALDVERGWPGFRYEYGRFGGLLTAITNSEGERIEYRYVDRGKIQSVVEIADGSPTHDFRFYAKGASGLYRTIHTNPLGGATRYSFDADRRLHSVERETTGETHTIFWSADGRRPSAEVSASGATTTYTFEGDDPVSIVEPSGNTISILYEAGGLNTSDPFTRAVRRVEDGIGLIEERSYDALGRPQHVSNGEGETTTTTYGPATVSSVAGPFGATRYFAQYGLHGHWLTVDGPLADKRSFDPVGNVLVPATVERRGGVLRHAYDANRNLVSLDVAATAEGRVVREDVVSVERRSDGGMTSVHRPGGSDHEFRYDVRGRIIERRERVDGQWQATTLEYDPAGNVTAKNRPNGMREEFEYDPFGRLERRRALRDGVLEGEAVFTWSAGLLASVYDSIRDASETYGYDTAGRRNHVVFSYGESTSFEYDLRSRISREIYALPGVGVVRTVAYEYDLAGREIRVSTGAGEVLIERVYQQGKLVEVRTGNGLTRTIGYDSETGSFSNAMTVDPLGEAVEATSVTRSIEAGPARQQIAVTTETPLGVTEEQYWLGVGGSLQDPDKLVGKRVFAWNDGNGSSRTYEYDESSNRVSDADGDVFVYDADTARLLSADLAHEGVSVSYSYDAAGFATSRNGVPIAWTATGRMSSHGPIEIEWDMLDRLVSSSAGGVTREVFLFGGRVASDPDTGALAALDLGEVAISFGSSERSYRHFDFRGNVSFVSDENGGIVSHYQYHPYGVEAVLGANGSDPSFVGRSDVGPLMLLGERMYDPLIGRFLSPDPVFSLLNQYAYGLGNPVWFSDPDGRQSGSLSAAISNADLQEILDGVGVALMIAVGLVPAAGPQVAVAWGLVMLAVLIAERASAGVAASSPNGVGPAEFTGSLAGPQAASSPGVGAAGSDLPVGPACAPVSLSSLERPLPILVWILALQVFLAMIVLRRRRLRPGGEPC